MPDTYALDDDYGRHTVIREDPIGVRLIIGMEDRNFTREQWARLVSHGDEILGVHDEGDASA